MGCGGSKESAAPQDTQAPAESSQEQSQGGETAQPADTTRAIKDNMTIAMIEEPGALDPQASSMSSNSEVGIHIYDTLIFKNQETGELQPCLAESWEQKDDLTYIFHLRDDVNWHNGDKFTADDVVYTIKRLTTEPGTKSRYNTIDAENTKAIDDKTVELKLLKPWGKVLLYFTNGLSCIVNQKVAEDPNSNMARNPIGTGPYKFAKWTTGDSIILERNEDYWGEKALTKQLTFKFFTDSSIRAIQLEAGDIDFFFNVGSEDYDRLMDNPDLVVASETGYTHESMYFGQTCDSVYQDVRVRKALAYALDIPAVVEAVWGPMAIPADSIYSSMLEGHITVGPMPHDIDKAKELLTEAGYPDGIDCEIIVPNDSNTLAYLEIMQAMWAEAGIRMTISSYDHATVKEMNASGTNPFGRSNFTASTGDPVHALAAWEIGYSGVMQPQDTHIDDLIKKTRAESDDAKRAEYLEEIQRYALDEMCYAIPVAFIKVSYAMNKNVFGFVFSPGETVYFTQMGVYAD